VFSELEEYSVLELEEQEMDFAPDEQVMDSALEGGKILVPEEGSKTRLPLSKRQEEVAGYCRGSCRN
jgi:hypothetical protein